MSVSFHVVTEHMIVNTEILLLVNKKQRRLWIWKAYQKHSPIELLDWIAFFLWIAIGEVLPSSLPEDERLVDKIKSFSYIKINMYITVHAEGYLTTAQVIYPSDCIQC